METLRYFYHPDLSIWLSVDPMSDSLPNLTSYNYCQWNPIRRVDPAGMLDGNLDKIDFKSNTNGEGDPLRKTQQQGTSNTEKNKNCAERVLSAVWETFVKIGAALEGGSDGANTGRSSSDLENAIIDALTPGAKGFALFNPLVGVYNSIKTTCMGKDMYGTEVSTANRVVAGVGIVAGGTCITTSGKVGELAKWIDRGINSWTVFHTIRAECKIQNNNHNNNESKKK